FFGVLGVAPRSDGMGTVPRTCFFFCEVSPIATVQSSKTESRAVGQNGSVASRVRVVRIRGRTREVPEAASLAAEDTDRGGRRRRATRARRSRNPFCPTALWQQFLIRSPPGGPDHTASQNRNRD